MRAIPTSVAVLVLGGIFTALAGSRQISPFEKLPFQERSRAFLENRLSKIDSELAQLAHYSLGGGVGAIGYRSEPQETSDHPEWIEIDFGKTVPLDEVMLVPAIRRDTANEFQADAFPNAFRLIAGTAKDRVGTVVAEYDSSEDNILPRIAPFVIPCNGIAASWIRVEAEQLTRRAVDQRLVFQLSEILAFSEQENMALRRPVKTSSNVPSPSGAWDERFVVDGFVPYLMDAARGEQSVAYLARIGLEEHPVLTLDLGMAYPVSGIHLHAPEQSDTLPQAYAGDMGIPKRMRIEGANQSDFSDSITLLDLRHETAYDSGPIIMWPFPETACRYIRLRVIDPPPALPFSKVPPLFGFTEIEVLSKGRNIALHKTLTSSIINARKTRLPSSLTDGRNMYGNILPIRDWLNQLALRHELETERPLVVDELNRRYALQKTNLRRMSWLAALLAAATGFTILIDRILRQRTVFQTRERIAANLHDELGANLHAIGLLGDFAKRIVDRKNAREEWPELIDTVDGIRTLTEETGATARYCTNMLEAEGLYQDLPEEMKRISARLLADLEHEITFSNEEVLHRLKPRRRIDLFLFYKECLTNIIRHSGATEVRTQLIAGSKQIRLIIADNGHGMNGKVPASLKRRARLLGAQVIAEKPDSGGTCIILKLKIRKWKNLTI
ncbi:histidine kinase [Pontiellaceae bacterium B12219]|nr:histidine kinase [Pontiellaceae bacterium B12219]